MAQIKIGITNNQCWLFWVVAICLMTGCISSGSEYKCGKLWTPRQDPLQPPLTIADKSSDIQLVQTLEGVFLSSLALDDRTAFITGSFDKFENDHFFSFDMVTEEVNWETCDSTGVMAVDKNAVYIWGRDPGLVTAYERGAGAKIWQNSVDREYPIIDALDRVPLGLLVESRNRAGTRFHLLDFETGEIKRSFESEAEMQKFWVDNGFTAYSTDGDLVLANGNAKWGTLVQYEPKPNNVFNEFIEPIITDDVILVYRSDIHNYFQIAALDKGNGETLWQTEIQTKSNLAVTSEQIFLVATNTELVSFDLITGQISHYVTFTPGIQEMSGQRTDAVVAADDDLILAYFSSSHQLFTFRLPLEQDDIDWGEEW